MASQSRKSPPGARTAWTIARSRKPKFSLASLPANRRCSTGRAPSTISSMSRGVSLGLQLVRGPERARAEEPDGQLGERGAVGPDELTRVVEPVAVVDR